MCCRGKPSVHPENCVRGLPVFSSLKLHKLMSFAAKAYLSGSFHDTAGTQRGESTSYFSLPTQENPLLIPECADVQSKATSSLFLGSEELGRVYAHCTRAPTELVMVCEHRTSPKDLSLTPAPTLSPCI